MNEVEQIREAQEAQERAEAHTDLLERLRKERAEHHARKCDIYFDDPAMEHLADMVHWSMEKSAVDNGAIKSHADGLSILQLLVEAYQSLIEDEARPANFDEEVSMVLAELAGVAMRIVIDLGVCDDNAIGDGSGWDDIVINP